MSVIGAAVLLMFTLEGLKSGIFAGFSCYFKAGAPAYTGREPVVIFGIFSHLLMEFPASEEATECVYCR